MSTFSYTRYGVVMNNGVQINVNDEESCKAIEEYLDSNSDSNFIFAVGRSEYYETGHLIHVQNISHIIVWPADAAQS